MCNLAWGEAGFNSRTTFGDVDVPLLGLHVLALHFAFTCSPQKKKTKKKHRLTNTIHLSLKMTSAQVVETSVTTNNSSFQNYSHPDDHSIRTGCLPLCQRFRKFRSECNFDFFRPEYSGSALEVVYLIRLEYSDRNNFAALFLTEFRRNEKE